MRGREEQLDVFAVEGLYKLFNQLHVLLRHLSPSIAQTGIPDLTAGRVSFDGLDSAREERLARAEP